ncbi:glycosyltransferase [Aurantiacibacter sediminis]|uniref:Glycosyltransferase n=1 Tax=Aurantiacibacter sediminis TaxID=2793064 RepID=A0ABS0MZW8_9SPHN|nr:glycosyltransferase [Aurantiacibacter sediminis]MBH5321255.1 glycosyltransferase [Aurantiacibacter sediminis]
MSTGDTASIGKGEGRAQSKRPPFSVIIPAHNEELVIARCLNAIVDGVAPEDLPEIIVAANGCSDRTVKTARETAPSAMVLDLPAGSKVIAMNTANTHATVTPRFFLDADVQCDYRSLLATAKVLKEPGVMAASPRLEMDLRGFDRWVRAYYRVWLTQPYVRDRLVGSGVFGLSAEGLETIGTIPPTFADDSWVRTRFSYEERRNVAQDECGGEVSFTVTPPRTVSDLVRIEARRRIGSEQVRVLYPSPHNGRINRPGDLRTALSDGASIADVVIYLSLKAVALLRYRWDKLRGKSPRWVRDEKARQAA